MTDLQARQNKDVNNAENGNETYFGDFKAQNDDLAEEIAETVDPFETLALNH